MASLIKFPFIGLFVSFYIIIRGPLGVGKSTISKKLAQKLKGGHISVDSVLEEHGLDKVEGRCIPAKNFIKTNEIAIPEIKEMLTKGVVIIDGNFYHKEQIEHLIEKLDTKHYVFTLEASVEACIERDRDRPKTYGEETAIAVHTLVSEVEYGQTIETAHKTEEEVVEEILANLA